MSGGMLRQVVQSRHHSVVVVVCGGAQKDQTGQWGQEWPDEGHN